MGVHASDGMDEISLCGTTHAYEYLSDDPVAHQLGKSRALEIRPENHGFGCVPLDSLQGGTAAENAALLLDILRGERIPHRDVVVLNAAYALYVSGRFPEVTLGLEAAQESIDSGAALRQLERLIEVSNRPELS